MEETEYEGVTYLPEQMAYRAKVDGPSGPIFEDYFGDGQSAALVRELVILVRGINTPRNFEDLSLEGVCQRLHRELVERDLLGVPGAMNWLAAVPMTENVFRSYVDGAA